MVFEPFADARPVVLMETHQSQQLIAQLVFFEADLTLLVLGGTVRVVRCFVGRLWQH